MTVSARPDAVAPVDRSWPAGWLLTQPERGNPDTVLDAGRQPGEAWSTGNSVRPLIHGAAYFGELAAAVARMRAGDLLLFTDWRGDPDDRLTPDAGSTVARVLGGAARRGVVVRGLIWRSHLDRLQFSAAENRHVGEDVDAAGGVCLLDMRVRPGGSHHQKFVVLRHPGRPALDVAFVGGIDLCHSRRDDAEHAGDEQRQPMAAVYGPRPPWHDVQLEIRGPAVADVETVFRERWEDPRPLSRDPIRVLADRFRHDEPADRQLPPQLPPPPSTGRHVVQLLRTYPALRRGYAFARGGERSVARGYAKALARARRLVYLEDQYLWSSEIVQTFARALAGAPDLRLVAVLPHYPDQDGRFSKPPNDVGRSQALQLLRAAGGARFAAYGVENREGTPVYVHAKVCVVDDLWASVGSDNVNRRSWTHDSELAVAVLDADPPADPGRSGAAVRTYARALRLALAREHLDRAEGDDEDLLEAASMFRAFARSAATLQAWRQHPQGPRPPGRLRPLHVPAVSGAARLWAVPAYRVVYDPDGRRRRERRAGRF